ncbi:hypothetical protein [Salinicoccus roseus]|uniref:hypothetical protein n=1 Tax=Salinicoccus roseus TaxID=45670 RepID=UPI0023017AE1|nr:hypothetical protein [Salinicoccus roseus]
MKKHTVIYVSLDNGKEKDIEDIANFEAITTLDSNLRMQSDIDAEVIEPHTQHHFTYNTSFGHTQHLEELRGHLQRLPFDSVIFSMDHSSKLYINPTDDRKKHESLNKTWVKLLSAIHTEARFVSHILINGVVLPLTPVYYLLRALQRHKTSNRILPDFDIIHRRDVRKCAGDLLNIIMKEKESDALRLPLWPDEQENLFHEMFKEDRLLGYFSYNDYTHSPHQKLKRFAQFHEKIGVDSISHIFVDTPNKDQIQPNISSSWLKCFELEFGENPSLSPKLLELMHHLTNEDVHYLYVYDLNEFSTDYLLQQRIRMYLLYYNVKVITLEGVLY